MPETPQPSIGAALLDHPLIRDLEFFDLEIHQSCRQESFRKGIPAGAKLPMKKVSPPQIPTVCAMRGVRKLFLLPGNRGSDLLGNHRRPRGIRVDAVGKH